MKTKEKKEGRKRTSDGHLEVLSSNVNSSFSKGVHSCRSENGKVRSQLRVDRTTRATRERRGRRRKNEPASVQIPRTDWNRVEGRGRKSQHTSFRRTKQRTTLEKKEEASQRPKLTLSTRTVAHLLSESSEVDSSLEGHLGT